MKSRWLATTLVSAALLAACTDSPNMKELPGVGGSACVDGMTIRFDIKGKLSYVSYMVLSEGTDQEIWNWLYSERKIAYASWSKKFYMKEVAPGGKKNSADWTYEDIETQDMYEFSLNECM